MHALLLHGEVVRLDGEGGSGFVRIPDGNECCFNRDNVADTPFEHMQTGSAVQFLPEAGGQAREPGQTRHGLSGQREWTGMDSM